MFTNTHTHTSNSQVVFILVKLVLFFFFFEEKNDYTVTKNAWCVEATKKGKPAKGTINSHTHIKKNRTKKKKTQQKHANDVFGPQNIVACHLN